MATARTGTPIMRQANIVLGAGPSGLGAALGLLEAGAESIIVLDRRSQVGGLSGSFSWAGCTIDYGPHRFSPEFPEWNQRIQGWLGEEWLAVPNEHAVYFRSRFYRYPPRLRDFLHTDTMAFSAKVIGSRATHRKNKAGTFEAKIKNTFGPVLFDSVVSPLCEKVWGESQNLVPSFAEQRFSVPTFVQWGKKLLHAKSTFSDSLFYYPKHGFQQLWDRIAGELRSRGVQIWLESEINAVHTENGQVTEVVLQGPNGAIPLPVANLISTIPSEVFTSLCQGAPTFAKERFRNRAMVLGVFLIKKPSVLPARVVIFPEKAVSFNRLCEQNLFSRHTVPEGYSVVVADRVLDLDSPEWQRSDKTLIESLLTDLLKLGLFTKADLVDSTLERVPVAYPVPNQDREEIQGLISDWAHAIPNLILTGRFASSDYNNSHTALKKGYLAGKLSAEGEIAQYHAEAEAIRSLPIRD